MAKWKPKVTDGTDLTTLDLNAEEGFVLSRVDGLSTIDDLTHVTGMDREQVKGILKKLIKGGAVDRPPPVRKPGAKKAAPKKQVPAPVAEVEKPVEEAPQEEPDQDEDSAARASETDQAEQKSEGEGEGEGGGDGEEEDEEESEEEGEEGFEEEDEEEDIDAGNLRKYFMEKLAPQSDDIRMSQAQGASGSILLAYCFDPNPKVIQSVMRNMKAGLSHARLIAQHHHNAAGLSALGKKSQFLRDRQVQRWLFKNTQLPDALFQRIIQTRRLLDVYQLAISREVTERVKSTAKKSFRKKFISAPSEEKVMLIFKCEGRCLNLLIGVALDGRSAALLTQRAVHSTLLIQNLARWPTSPPSVLLHLSKQGPVKRQPNLKNIIARHPNAPAALKAGKTRR